MGNTGCCSDGSNDLDLKIGEHENIYQARYFYLYPKAKATFEALTLTPNYKKISRSSMTKFDEGVYLGKECRIRHGLGIMIYEAEGLYYMGNFINGNRQGLGYMLNSDGSYYQGEWYLNEPHGYGEYYSPDHKWVYKGKWKSGVKEGLGEEYFPDGTVFKGYFHEGVKEGEGMLSFTNECIYDDRDQRQVSNLKASANGGGKLKCSFKGIFKGDVATGFGIQRGENYKYEGNWENNEMHGAGKSTYFNESGKPAEYYIGQFNKGVKEGFGEYRWADGRVYKGEWLGGELVSRGVFIDRRE